MAEQNNVHICSTAVLLIMISIAAVTVLHVSLTGSISAYYACVIGRHRQCFSECFACVTDRHWYWKSCKFAIQGCSFAQTVLLTPLMFGVAHVHHLVEMVKFQGVKLTTAVMLVSL